MTTITQHTEAIIVRHQWWKCSACGQTLGEVIAGRVLIKIGNRRLSLPAIPGVDQHCPKCGQRCELIAA